MDNLFFVESTRAFKREGSFLAWVPSINKEADLFEYLPKALGYPDNCGHNWDALYDIFFDFTWIEEKTIVVVHENFSELCVADLNRYMDIVKESIEVWKDGLEHVLIFVFCEHDRKQILESLNYTFNK